MKVEAAFEEYRGEMRRSVAYFCGDGETAEEAVQNAFVKALMNRAMLESMPQPAMRAWLFASARNSAVDIKRKEKRLVYFLDENLPFNQPDPNDRLLVESLMSGLEEKLAGPVRLKYFTGMSSAEIGQALGIPAATVRTRLRAAMKQMRERMGESGG